MMIKTAKFVKSVADKKSFLEDRPSFVFAGKSNCGKSTLINSICGNKKLARSSSTPGCTKLVNYFLVNDAFYFVDLPGYGFSKTGKSKASDFGALVQSFFEQGKNIKQVFILIDIRNGASQNDEIMLNFCYYYQIPFTVIATKADKISRSQCLLKRRALAGELKIGEDNIILSSSVLKIGRDEILAKIESLI